MNDPNRQVYSQQYMTGLEKFMKSNFLYETAEIPYICIQLTQALHGPSPQLRRVETGQLNNGTKDIRYKKSAGLDLVNFSINIIT